MDALLSRIDKSRDCWLWTGKVRTDGYGSYRDRLAHRLVFEAMRGPIPQLAVLCHRCDNPRCVNPEHLFVGSQGDNVRDCRDKGRMRGQGLTHCVNGHEFTEPNTYLRPRGGRDCRTCIRSRVAAYRSRRKSA